MTEDTQMDKYLIAVVPMTMIELVWAKVIPHLQRVVDVAHGEITLETVKNRLISGKSLLVTISQGDQIIAINTLELRVMDSGLRAMFIPITGGDDLDGWMPQFLVMANAIAKDYQCTELRGLSVRAGWMKKLSVFGWENVHMVIRCPVSNDDSELKENNEQMNQGNE